MIQRFSKYALKSLVEFLSVNEFRLCHDDTMGYKNIINDFLCVVFYLKTWTVVISLSHVN